MPLTPPNGVSRLTGRSRDGASARIQAHPVKKGNPSRPLRLETLSASSAQLEELYERRYATFRRGLHAIVGVPDLAHDVVQEAFIQALRHRHQFRGDGSLEGWVWRIALRIALNGTNGSAPLDEKALQTVAAPASPDDPDLTAALRTLPPRRRLIVFLRYFADLSYAEIADACDVSVGTVGAALTQAHAELHALVCMEGARR